MLEIGKILREKIADFEEINRGFSNEPGNIFCVVHIELSIKEDVK